MQMRKNTRGFPLGFNAKTWAEYKGSIKKEANKEA